MLSQLKSTIDKTYQKLVYDHRSKAEAKYDNRNVGNYLTNNTTLSPDEKKTIREKWGGIVSCIPRGFDYFRGIKSLCGFNPDYLPSSYFYPYIEDVLNPEKWKRQLWHKSMIQLAYGVGIKHPYTLLRTYGGMFFNNDYKPLTLKEALSVIKKCVSPLLYKPSIGSEQGHGVRMIHPNGFAELCNEILTGRIFDVHSDFVLQMPVMQSDETSIFNPSSLNCMRITTININDKISIGSRAIKCGPNGSIVDNIGTGKRGVIVGVNTDGSLCDKGFYGNGETAEEHNGVSFKGMMIGHFHRVIDAAVQLHRYAPMCKIIGWDIALDSDNEPVLIEGNVVYPGISMEQMCSGPIFGNRTDEVIAYVTGCMHKR